MTTLLHDVRHAARGLARSPGFAALAALTLALGVGAHAAIFGWVDAVFLRPLPVPEADRLVGVYETRDGAGYYPLSLPDFADYRERVSALSGLAAHYPAAPLILGPGMGSGPGSGGEPQGEIVGSVVSPEYFRVLGVEPARGRFFLPEEGGPPGAHPVAVVSHHFWHTRLGGREDVLGTVVTLNDTAFTVVGVAPEGFRGVRLGAPVEVWIPTSMAGVGYRWCDAASRDCTWIEMIGRLAPGRTIVEARAEMAVLSAQVRAAHLSADPTVRGLAVEPLRGVHPSARPRMLRLTALLLVAVTLVLLVAAANLGGLLVARNLTRRREIATRLAVGAGRWRVVRESIVETLLLAVTGGVAGLLVAAWLGRVVAVLSPSEGPIDLAPGAAVAGYAALLSGLTGVLVGLATGLQCSRPGLVAALRDEASAGSRRRPRVLGALVVVQVALSFVLLTATGLLVRSVQAADRLGAVDPDRVATLRLRPRLIGYGPERARPFTREVVRRLEALPGVESVTLGRVVPPWGGIDVLPEEPEVVEVGFRFFETFGFRLVRGRPIDGRDVSGGPPVVVVNRALAGARWPDRDALGQLLAVGGRTYRVVGVVEDTAYRSLTQVSPPLAYTAYWQDPELVDARVAVRTTGDAADLLAVLEREVRAVDPAVPVTEVGTLTTRLARLLGPVHLARRGLAASAALAVLLAAVGLYGVLALAVARRRHDIGIRMALGGTRLRVVALVVGDALALVGVALGLGLVAAFLAARGLAHQLYGVGPGDPATFAAAVALFVFVAGLASWWPARRAARIDPARALRRP